MIRVLIVEDDPVKLGRLRDIVVAAGVSEERVDYCMSTADAYHNLSCSKYDLMLLDINLPRRLGEASRRGEGLEILRRLSRESSLNKPLYIVGVTAYEDVYAEFGDDFADHLWTLVHYTENSDRWIAQVSAKVSYVLAARQSFNFSDGQTFGIDVGIVCALEGVELAAIRRLPCGWQPLRVAHDEARYFAGTISTPKRELSLVAVAAPRMGMPASAVLAAKLISTFRPRVIAMSGICAGRASETALGDAVIARPSWDWGSGKIDSQNKVARFRPSPHQIELDVDVDELLRGVFSDVELLARIKANCRGAKPQNELNVHIAPMASGAAVVANSQTFEALLDKNRDLTGLDMEAYGIFVASRGMGKPRPIPLVIKSVCDFADETKSDDFQEYAAETSAHVLLHALGELFAGDVV